ncbi:hypothetical protein AADZ86_14215 [Colwelliaceae bacterium BS250]
MSIYMDIIDNNSLSMTILDQNVPLMPNMFFALQRHRTLWLLLILSALFDFITTINFMINDSIALEANLIIRYLAYQLGIFPGVFIGKLLQLFAGLCFCALTRHHSGLVLLLLILLNCVAIFINTAF